jgi:hypothetical protein
MAWQRAWGDGTNRGGRNKTYQIAAVFVFNDARSFLFPSNWEEAALNASA